MRAVRIKMPVDTGPPARDEAILALVRALAIRRAREDHAAYEARKRRRKAKTLPAARD